MWLYDVKITFVCDEDILRFVLARGSPITTIPVNRWMDGWMDGLIDEWMDGWMNGWVDG